LTLAAVFDRQVHSTQNILMSESE